MTLLVAIAISIFLFAVGFIVGGRTENSYWADHEKDNSCICYKGKFYRVITEERAVELDATERAFHNRLEEGSYHHG